MSKIPQICLIGYAGRKEYPIETCIPEYSYACAEELGRLIGKQNWFLVTGGESGIMETSSRGCKRSGGTTFGVLTGDSSNTYIDIEVVTNSYVTGSTPTLIGMGDIIIVCGGGAGTLQEIAIAYRLNKPIILMQNTGGWADRITDKYLDERKKYPILRAINPTACITICQNILKTRKEVNKNE